MAKTETQTELIKVSEAARRLSVHPDTVRNMIRRGELNGTKVGKHYRVSLDPVMEAVGAARNG